MLQKIKSLIAEFYVFELFVGMRYTRAKRKNHFISFISLTSMIGIALGVAALIIVLSVMNGFQKDLRTRILGVASHLEITGINNTLEDWPSIASSTSKREHVLASAPYITAQAMLSYGQGVQGAIIRGILPVDQPHSLSVFTDFGFYFHSIAEQGVDILIDVVEALFIGISGFIKIK